MTSSDTTAEGSQSSPPASPPPLQPPPPAPRVTAPPLTVRRPLSSLLTRSTTTPSDTDDFAGAPDPVPAESGSTRSSDTAAVSLDTRSITDIARGAVLTASMRVHNTLAIEDEPEEEDLWLARETDQKQIGDPLAKIVGRRGLGAAAINPDIANLIEAGLGLLAYTIFHAGRQWTLRRARRKIARLNGAPMRHDNGEPA